MIATLQPPRPMHQPPSRLPSPPQERPAPAPASLADTIYRRYVIGGVVVILTVGASWGAWLLWRIGVAGDFTQVSLHDVNAHGHAQIYGWVGLFIMGMAYQAMPRLWRTPLARPRLAALAFVLMAVGIGVRTLGMTLAELGDPAVAAALAGGAMEIAAIVIFVTQMVATFRRSPERWEPYMGFVLGALFWFVAMSLMCLWHTWATMTASTRDQLLWAVATYQAPLRDLQIHGLALFMVLGVSMRLLPALFGVPQTPPRMAWSALAILTAAVVLESGIFILYRMTGNHALAAMLMLPWLMLAVGCAMAAGPWRLWRPLPIRERSGKFVRAAYVWLAVSLAMLLLLPVYQTISGLPFSHAYYGAIRHAITVGFVSLMIMGMSARIVASLNGLDTRSLTPLLGPFLLVNTGCLLRVSFQTLTDWHGGFFAVVGLSGMLEVAGLAWWGQHVIWMIRRGRRENGCGGSSLCGCGARGVPASIAAAG